MIKAVGFDLGNTLITSSFPLSWQDYYSMALRDILTSIDRDVTDSRIRIGEGVFLKYNTRVYTREYEVDADTIFTELFRAWGFRDMSMLKPAKTAFAEYFLMKSELFPETGEVLKSLRDKGLKTGVLTNLAYGMGGEYLMRDVSEIDRYMDVFLTSLDIGFRKPHISGFLQLAERLEVRPCECLFVGDEEVDIAGANACGMISVLIDREGKGGNFGQQHTISGLDELLVLI